MQIKVSECLHCSRKLFYSILLDYNANGLLGQLEVVQLTKTTAKLTKSTQMFAIKLVTCSAGQKVSQSFLSLFIEM